MGGPNHILQHVPSENPTENPTTQPTLLDVDIGSVDLFQVHYRTVSFSPALMK
jgi:hypothetical protein